MRSTSRLIAAAVLIAFSGLLGGCSSGGFDPSDMLDFLDNKKKLPGERKEVFPGGVPGMEQGVPKELYKGAQERQEQQNADAAAAAAAQPAEPPKAKSAKSAKSSKAKRSATANAVPAEPDGEAMPQEQPAEAPQTRGIARKRTTAPPPDQTDQSEQQPITPFPAPTR